MNTPFFSCFLDKRDDALPTMLAASDVELVALLIEPIDDIRLGHRLTDTQWSGDYSRVGPVRHSVAVGVNQAKKH